ncbi:MAG: hypothetical protein AB7U29_12680 [Desulfobulbus sp.]
MNEQTIVNAPTSQGRPITVVTTEQFMANMHKQLYAQYGTLDEPDEVLSQPLALIRLASSSVNEDGKGFAVNVEDVDWTLMLAMDLIKEREKRLNQERAYQKSEREELERHLDTCYLIPTGPDQWVRFENGEDAQ